jgi:hypothetical protein
MPNYSHTTQALVHLEKKLETVLTEVREALTEHEREKTPASDTDNWEKSFSEDKESFVAP